MNNDVKLHHGNCLQIMDNLIDSNIRIDLTVTSPPYDKLRTYNDSTDSWNDNIWKGCIERLYHITKEGGVVVWVVNDATINGSETGTSFRQALYAIDIGFNLHDTMIWEKQTFTATGSLNSRYAPVFEYMFIWSKGKPKTFNPIKDRQTKGIRKKHGTIRQKDGTTKLQSSIGKIYGSEYAQRFNIWHINTEVSNAKRRHPAQFPEQLAKDHIISWSNEGDTVLDCFMGSGTTGVVCKKYNRNFIGIEKDITYFKIAEKRIKETEINQSWLNS